MDAGDRDHSPAAKWEVAFGDVIALVEDVATGQPVDEFDVLHAAIDPLPPLGPGSGSTVVQTRYGDMRVTWRPGDAG